jgi:hypothetical protein
MRESNRFVKVWSVEITPLHLEISCSNHASKGSTFRFVD